MIRRFFSIKSLSLQGRAALVILIALITVGIVSPIISGYSYREPSGAPLMSPGQGHILGTDDLGIDLWAQICHGTGISLLIGLSSALIAGAGGALIGAAAASFGGVTDKVLMGLCDTMTVIPRLPMMIILGAFWGPSFITIVFVVALLSWPHPARTVRAVILSVREEPYVKASRSWGAGFWHLTRKHFFPSVFPLVVISIIKISGQAITAEAGMAFLGLGDPLSKSWGIILNRSINFSGIYFTEYWKWWIMSPLTALILLILSLALLGRDLEKTMGISPK